MLYGAHSRKLFYSFYVALLTLSYLPPASAMHMHHFSLREKDLPETRLFLARKRKENIERGCKWRAGVGIVRIRREKSPPLLSKRQQAGNQQWANGWNQILPALASFFLSLSLFSGAECLKSVKWGLALFSIPLAHDLSISSLSPFRFRSLYKLNLDVGDSPR